MIPRFHPQDFLPYQLEEVLPSSLPMGNENRLAVSPQGDQNQCHRLYPPLPFSTPCVKEGPGEGYGPHLQDPPQGDQSIPEIPCQGKPQGQKIPSTTLVEDGPKEMVLGVSPPPQEEFLEKAYSLTGHLHRCLIEGMGIPQLEEVLEVRSVVLSVPETSHQHSKTSDSLHIAVNSLQMQHGSHIWVPCDYNTTVHCINKGGSVKFPVLNRRVLSLQLLLRKRGSSQPST